jgi:hypothetical protein
MHLLTINLNLNFMKKRKLYLVIFILSLIYSGCKKDNNNSSGNILNNTSTSKLLKKVTDKYGTDLFIYDSNNKLKTVEHYDSGGTYKRGYDNYLYNSDGTINKYEDYWNDKLDDFQTYSYSGNTMTIIEYFDYHNNANFKEAYKYICTLNTNKLLTKIEFFNKDTITNLWKEDGYSNLVWENNNLKKIETYTDTTLKKKNNQKKYIRDRHIFTFLHNGLNNIPTKSIKGFVNTQNTNINSYDNMNNPYWDFGSYLILDYMVVRNNPLLLTTDYNYKNPTERHETIYQYEYNDKSYPVKTIETEKDYINGALDRTYINTTVLEYY